MDNNTLGDNIARFRKAAGLTQEELGTTVGVSAQAVSRWECGGAPDVALLPAIADALAVSTDALFGREPLGVRRRAGHLPPPRRRRRPRRLHRFPLRPRARRSD